MKKLLAIALFASLAGCASHYVAPAAGPTASLTFSAEGLPDGAWVLVQNFADERCAASEHGNRLATFTTRAVQGQGDPHSGVARQLPAGVPAVTSFIYQTGAAGFTTTTNCTITTSFVPEAGGHYRVHYRMFPGACAVDVTREDGGAATPVPAKKIEPPCNNIVTG